MGILGTSKNSIETGIIPKETRFQSYQKCFPRLDTPENQVQASPPPMTAIILIPRYDHDFDHFTESIHFVWQTFYTQAILAKRGVCLISYNFMVVQYVEGI